MNRLLIGLSLCLACLGCGGGAGEKLAKVSGTLLKEGQPLRVAGEEAGLGFVQIQLFAIDDSGVQSTDPESARVDASGAFQIAGAEGRGIPHGKYRVVVRQWDPYPEDKLAGAFDEERSPIERVIDGPAVLAIDLAQP